MRTRYNRYICYRKKTITICKHEGYLSQARHIISYFKTVCVYDMIDLNSMVFMFKQIIGMLSTEHIIHEYFIGD